MTWPLHGLVLRTPDLELRGTSEADATVLQSRKPADLRSDPSRTSVGHDVLQAYWRGVGSWAPDAWECSFTVVHEGELVGVQALEGKDFSVLRTVDSWSWLVPQVRGRGLGKQMRTAVLELAFRGLGATHAITEAWDDNAASLGVSRSLGYVDNGVFAQKRDGGPGRMVHLVLAASDWHPAYPVEVEGLEPCLPLFGL